MQLPASVARVRSIALAHWDEAAVYQFRQVRISPSSLRALLLIVDGEQANLSVLKRVQAIGGECADPLALAASNGTSIRYLVSSRFAARTVIFVIASLLFNFYIQLFRN